jgi:hypothetical protein
MRYLMGHYDREYFEDKPNWFVQLSSGEYFYQHDHGLGNEAWAQLKYYCELHDLTILNFGARNRDNVIYPLPSSAGGYFFIKGALCSINESHQWQLFIMGVTDGKTIWTSTVKVPEMLIIETDSRPYEGNEGQCITTGLKCLEGGENSQSPNI